MHTSMDAKSMAKILRHELQQRQVSISHSEGLEMVAKLHGCDNWNVLAARIAADQSASPGFGQAIPIIRILSMDAARDFYLDWLGFSIDWEHRFEEDFPLYVQISRDGLTLHLSEHHGDATPGSTCFVWTEDITAFHRDLTEKQYGMNRPSIEDLAWGRQVEVVDPFSNRIRFCEKAKSPTRT